MKLLSIFLIILSGYSYAKEHPKNIAQLWLNKTTPGYITFCGPGNYGKSELLLLNKSESFYQTDADKPGARYFYYPGIYEFVFKCDLQTFQDGNQQVHFVETIKQRIELEGGKVYDVQLKLKDSDNFQGCEVLFLDKYTKNIFPSLVLSSKVKTQEKHDEAGCGKHNKQINKD